MTVRFINVSNDQAEVNTQIKALSTLTAKTGKRRFYTKLTSAHATEQNCTAAV